MSAKVQLCDGDCGNIYYAIDLNETFYFPEGNIDHMTLDGNQNFDKRTFSSNANNFYKYYDFDNIYYCGAGSFPCGSVAGTPGYMCAKQLIRSDQ